MSKALAIRSTSNSLTMPDVRGKANPYFIARASARTMLLQHIKASPGRYTVVDLMGITGITAYRINRFLADDKEFIKLAQDGAVAVPRMGKRPKWFNGNTPIVAESFYKGAYVMSDFKMKGDPAVTRMATRIFSLTRAALASSNRAPQTVMMLSDQIKEDLISSASQINDRVQSVKSNAGQISREAGAAPDVPMLTAPATTKTRKRSASASKAKNSPAQKTKRQSSKAAA